MNIFHISHTTTIKELKQQYYQLALLCHPDHGGNAEDMQIVHESYAKAKEQLAYQETSQKKISELLEKMEKGEIFSQHNTFPTLREIFDDAHADFHTSFQKNISKVDNHKAPMLCDDVKNPFRVQGYGSKMLSESTLVMPKNGDPPLVYTPHIETNTSNTLPRLQNQDTLVNEDSKTQTICSKIQPHTSLPSTLYPIHIEPQQHIQDFSVFSIQSNTASQETVLSLFDYNHAFS